MEIRHARRGDADEVARVHVRAWQAAYRGLLPDAYLDALRPEDRAGYYRFYVDPPFWGSGTGRSLLARARDQLRDRGFSRAVLWVLAGNERAERFYRIDGWSGDGTQREAEVWGIGVEELRYSRGLT